MGMNLGNGIKPQKGALWAQALAPALLPGETIHLLVKGRAGGMLDDLVAITDLRVLSAQTQNHCRVKAETHLRDIAGIQQAAVMGSSAVQMTLHSGEKLRIVLAMVIGGNNVDLVLTTLQQLLTAGPPAHLQQAFQTQQESAQNAQARRAAAEEGIWPNSVVVGSRPRKKAAASILAHAHAGEEPWLIIGSLGAGVLAAFADRLVLIKTGAVTSAMAGSFGGERATTFYFHEITGIEYNSGLMSGVLEILTASYSGTANKDFWRGTFQSRNADSNDPYTLSNTMPLSKSEHAEAQPHLNELRHRITQFKRTVAVEAAPASTTTPPPPAPSNPSGLADEITKIAALRDSGILTEDEFQAAKARILSQ
ncbi:SHOCT domain-containing protein [Rothia sp. ARF10]|nr:SHOCT domain-containing protein [Rothia sp. ARF10]